MSEKPRPAGLLRHQPALDGLRGLAVATVLVYHSGFPWMAGGYLGVSTFFTLSGFLITSLLLAEYTATGRIALGAFWERRFRRILPASFAALVLVFVFGLYGADRYQRDHLRTDGFATLAYIVNWWFIFTRRDYADIFGSPSPVQHFWSLAIEEQFYLVFPLVCALVLRAEGGSRRALGLVLGVSCLASIGWLLWLAPSDVPTARLYFATDTRAAELLAGALLALFLSGHPMGARAAPWVSILGLAGLAWSGWCWISLRQDSIRLYQGGLTLYTAASVSIVAAAVLPGGPVRALLSAQLLRWLGRISYGVYLYHFPIFLWIDAEVLPADPAVLFVARMIPTILAAELSYRFLEMPIRSGRFLRDRGRWLAPPVAAGFLAALFATVPPLPADSSVPFASDSGHEIVASPDALRIMVVGDSVADNLASALQRWARNGTGAIVRAETRRGCGIAHGGIQDQRDAQTRALACSQWVETLATTTAEFRPDVVVVYTGGWDLIERRLPEWAEAKGIGDPEYDRWLRNEYEAVIEAFTASGARVAWISSLCVESSVLGPTGVFDPLRVTRLNDLLRQIVASNGKKATYVDLFGYVCPDGHVSQTIDGIEKARPDGVHFAEAAADRVAQWLAPQLPGVGGEFDSGSRRRSAHTR